MRRLRLRERRKGASPNYQGPRRRREDRAEHPHGAARTRPGGLADYLYAHRQALGAGLARMRRSPWATALTILVLGIALFLPTALKLLVDHLAELSGSWRQGAEISVFLEPGASDDDARRLRERLAGDPALRSMRVVTREAGLEQLRRQAGLGEALRLLGENPLPPVLVVTPASRDPADLEALQARLEGLPGVDLVQLDTRWVERLQALLDLAGRLVALLAILSAVAVAVIVGNTLRLLGQAHAQELRVSRLLGATDAQLRRPFLYTGLAYGLAGALCAYLLIHLGLLWLAPAVERLADLYHSGFRLHGPDAPTLALLTLAGPVLGLLTAWLVMQRRIRELERI